MDEHIFHDSAECAFYRRVLQELQRADIPFLVGGALAYEQYTGIVRRTKDLDIFVTADACRQIMGLMAEKGFETDLMYPTWLGKIRSGDYFVDVIFNSANGIVPVDDSWFTHASAGALCGVDVLLCPVEEMLWSKAFVMARERYDGADVAHLLRACADTLAWPRLLQRFGEQWRVLLSHLVMFGFIYPESRGQIPPRVISALTRKLMAESRAPSPADHVCNGTLLSWDQYLIDTERWGYDDGRAASAGMLTPDEVAQIKAQQFAEKEAGAGNAH